MTIVYRFSEGPLQIVRKPYPLWLGATLLWAFARLQVHHTAVSDGLGRRLLRPARGVVHDGGV